MMVRRKRRVRTMEILGRIGILKVGVVRIGMAIGTGMGLDGGDRGVDGAGDEEIWRHRYGRVSDDRNL